MDHEISFGPQKIFIVRSIPCFREPAFWNPKFEIWLGLQPCRAAPFRKFSTPVIPAKVESHEFVSSFLNLRENHRTRVSSKKFVTRILGAHPLEQEGDK